MTTMLLMPLLALAALLLLAGSYRSCAFGIGLTVLVFVTGAAAVEPLGFEVAAFHVYLEDFWGAVLLLSAVARLLARRPPGWQWMAWTPFLAATALAFLLGASWWGTQAAGVEYRGFFYLGAAVLYGASFPYDSTRMKRLVVLWLAGAGLLLALAWFRWWAGLLQLGIAARWEMVGGRNPWRVLNASQSLYLAQAFLMLLYLRRHCRAYALPAMAAVLLAGTVLLLQHRSVWIAAGVSWLAMAVHERHVRQLARALAVAAILLLLAWWCFPGLLRRADPLVASLQDSIEEPFSPRASTMTWRLGLWNEYLLEYASLPRAQMLVGTGLGNPGLYHVGLDAVEESAHNYFVFVLNRAGALGLLALLAGYGALLWRLRGTGGHWDYAGMLLILSISQLVFSVVYGPSYDQGILIGAGFGIAAGRVACAR